MLQTDSLIELLVEKPVAGGRMLARHDGQIVLVSGAIPGERVRARIERTTRGVAFAETREVLTSSPSRREARLDPACGGNVYAHVRYDAQIDIKRDVLRDALARGARISWTRDLPIAASPEQGYRMRARLHVRRGQVGFFREGTHALCDAALAEQLRVDAVAAVQAFVAATPRAWLDAIDAIELTENLEADQRALHLLWVGDKRQPQGDPPRDWTLARLPGITGLSSASGGTGRVRALAGAPFVSDPLAAILEDSNAAGETHAGDTGTGVTAAGATSGETARETAGQAAGARLQRHAASFFQANRFLLPRLVSAVRRHVGDEPVIDCYAGVGLFAVSLAAAGHDGGLLAIEGDPASSRDLIANAQPFGARLRVAQDSVERRLAQETVDRRATIIVDPPRTGLSREALEAVLRARPARIVYVSCDVATLARDLRGALEAGYELAHLEAFDLFPNTAHVESLAVLQRVDAS